MPPHAAGLPVSLLETLPEHQLRAAVSEPSGTAAARRTVPSRAQRRGCVRAEALGREAPGVPRAREKATVTGASKQGDEAREARGSRPCGGPWVRTVGGTAHGRRGDARLSALGQAAGHRVGEKVAAPVTWPRFGRGWEAEWGQ